MNKTYWIRTFIMQKNKQSKFGGKQEGLDIRIADLTAWHRMHQSVPKDGVYYWCVSSLSSQFKNHIDQPNEKKSRSKAVQFGLRIAE
jgi:hypothetical protein